MLFLDMLVVELNGRYSTYVDAPELFDRVELDDFL
jgi:hypothetical protein